MNTQATKWAAAVVGVMMLGLVPPSQAAPASSMAILKQAAQSSDVTDVRYYRRSYRGRAYYGNPGAAIGLGILGAAAGAAAYGAYGPRRPRLLRRARLLRRPLSPRLLLPVLRARLTLFGRGNLCHRPVPLNALAMRSRARSIGVTIAL